MRAIVMAGGQGMRLQPFTKVFPKPLVPLADVPILEIILRQLKRSGFTHITLTINYKGGLIRNYFGNGERLGLVIDYTEETKPLGTIGSLSLITDIEQPFLVMNADILTDLNFLEFYNSHFHNDAILTVMLAERKYSNAFGVVETNVQGHIIQYNEKPETSCNVSTGIYVMEPHILKYMKGDFLGVPDLIQQLISDEQIVMSHMHKGIWMDIGTPANLEEASKYFEQNRSQFLPDSDLLDSIKPISEVRDGLESLSL